MIRISLLAAALTLFACGPAPETSQTSTTTTSSQTCFEKHLCVNGSCHCTQGPQTDSPCCDPADSSCTTDKCDTFCKYCQ